MGVEWFVAIRGIDKIAANATICNSVNTDRPDVPWFGATAPLRWGLCWFDKMDAKILQRSRLVSELAAWVAGKPLVMDGMGSVTSGRVWGGLVRN